MLMRKRRCDVPGSENALASAQGSARGIQRLADRRIHFFGDGRWRQTLAASDEEIVVTRASLQAGQGMWLVAD